MKYLIISAYMFFWLILSENVSAERIIIGAIICALIWMFNKNQFFNKNFKWNFLKNKIKYAAIYIFVLLKEIVVANFQVAAIVLNPKIKIKPTIVSINTNIKSEGKQVILANSITLTPGTLTIGLDNNNLNIHCLDEKYVKDLKESKFEKILLKVED